MRNNSDKLRGGYYTPEEIAEFLCETLIKGNYKILEPSCGDGNFIRSIISTLRKKGLTDRQISSRIKGIELIKDEYIKTKNLVRSLSINPKCIRNDDFFNYVLTDCFRERKNGTYSIAKSFDLVIGNPPFIRYQDFPQEHREKAFRILDQLNFPYNKLTNIWVPFLIIGAHLLKNNGVLALVIPAELFQVKYASETRKFISDHFDRVTIITFKKLVFKGVQQEVVLLIAEKKSEKIKGIRTIEVENTNSLNPNLFENSKNIKVKHLDHTRDKWTQYFLDSDEISFLKNIKNKKKSTIKYGKDILSTDVGIVTGRNEFFLLRADDKKKWAIGRSYIKVIGKSEQLKGIIFTQYDYNRSNKIGQPVYMFLPPNKDLVSLNKNNKAYIKFGEEKEYHKGYKCSIRKRWYIVPSISIPQAFALRQVHDYPKLVMNEFNVSCSDTIHRVNFQNGVNGKHVVTSFINSLTFAFSEITGRSYGGGVLTFEPTEIEDLPVPISESLDAKRIDSLIRNKQIDEALDYVDGIVLSKELGFSLEEISKLRGIWKKLRDRRINRR